MRLLFAALLALAMSSSAFATVQVGVQPVSPIVISTTVTLQLSGQQVTVYGPWFYTELSISSSSETATLANAHFTITSIEGVVYQRDVQLGNVVVKPDQAQAFAIYMDSLPTSSSTVYGVDVNVTGANSSGQPVNLSGRFQTQ